MKRQGADTAPANDDIAALAERMRQALGDFVRAARAQAGTPSTARSETLGLLDREGAMSTAALAEHRNVKHQSMRLVVGQLKADGLIEQTTDPRDRRNQLVTLTAKGNATLISDRRARAGWIAAALRDRATLEERQTLDAALTVLKRVAAASPYEGSYDR